MIQCEGKAKGLYYKARYSGFFPLSGFTKPNFYNNATRSYDRGYHLEKLNYDNHEHVNMKEAEFTAHQMTEIKY